MRTLSWPGAGPKTSDWPGITPAVNELLRRPLPLQPPFISSSVIDAHRRLFTTASLTPAAEAGTCSSNPVFEEDAAASWTAASSAELGALAPACPAALPAPPLSGVLLNAGSGRQPERLSRGKLSPASSSSDSVDHRLCPTTPPGTAPPGATWRTLVPTKSRGAAAYW